MSEPPSPSEPSESRAVELIKIAEESCTFFCDQHGTPFVFLKNPGRTMQLLTRDFKVWLVKQFYDKHKEAVGSDAINAALNVLEAMAVERKRVKLSTRCAIEGEEIFVDLCNEKEEAVIITPYGWRVARPGKPTFRRYSHMLEMKITSSANQPDDVTALMAAMPGQNQVSKEARTELENFIRFWRLKEPEDEILLVGLIGHAFVPDIPHAITVAIGPHGSTKTSFTDSIRQLVDPSSVPNLTIGSRSDELVQQLAHHYAPNFDNSSQLRVWQSDDLCRASTGSGFSKRALYSNEDDVIFQFKRAVIINSINTPTHRGDFLDRSVLLEFARIPRNQRLEETEVVAIVAEQLPRLRSTVFTGLTIAMGLLSSVRKDELAAGGMPRMADFAVWGEAFCRAIGYKPMAFYNRLMNRVEETAAIALENDVVAELLVKLFDDENGKQYLTGKDEFEGTSSTLLKVLQNLNEDMKYVSPKELPSSPESLGTRLGELTADLGEIGIRIIKKRTGKQRGLVIQKSGTVVKTGEQQVKLEEPKLEPKLNQRFTPVEDGHPVSRLSWPSPESMKQGQHEADPSDGSDSRDSRDSRDSEGTSSAGVSPAGKATSYDPTPPAGLPDFIETIEFAGRSQLHCRDDGAYFRTEQIAKQHALQDHKKGQP